MNKQIALLAIGLLAGCSDVAKDTEAALREQMYDSDAAEFRNVRVVSKEAGDVVCGEVNGKNRFGGFVGFRPFVSIRGDDGEVIPFVIDEDAPYMAQRLHEEVCEGDAG